MDSNRPIIKYFDKGFIEEKQIISVERKGRLFSRKNNVYEIEVTFKGGKKYRCIFKEYVGINKYLKRKKEVFFYNILGGSKLNVADIFYTGKTFIVIEFISNRTLLDYITEKEESYNKTKNIDLDYLTGNNQPLIEACKYTIDFNMILKKATGYSYVLNDMNLRNFILTKKDIYRTDFEDCSPGDTEEDLGRLIAFLLTYDPSYTDWKTGISRIIKEFLVSSMNLDIAKIDAGIKRELERMKQRRNN